MFSQALKQNQDILIIEDDEDIADLISIYLRSQTYSTRTAPTLMAASQMWAESKPDLIICDIMLPDGQGTEWVQAIRQESMVPIIFLSSLSEREDIIRGLELGGDDYITKPFDPDIMVARVKARLRNTQSPSQRQQQAQPGARRGAPTGKKSGVWSDGRLELSFEGWEVMLGGQAVTLSTKERQLLFFLASHPGQVFSVEQLYEQIWGMDGWSDQRTVMVHISNLRRKIEDASGSHRYIATVRGIGYKFQPSTKVL
ncbi:response regulator transcription factor [Paenibacillus senegalensis]|uniref:response regulator transcription factor n=1 Tax=Paenibacillus senegalensis TaxID=1465766 RepID=UPI0002894E61|nr:response regulator transcription factor [Paenibacillus senegalensis]